MNDPVGNGTGKRLVLLVATIASFIFPFMASTVNIALPSLGKELSLDAVTLGWIATAYLLSSAALLVPFGRIADIYGRKKIFTLGIGIFTLSSLLSGLADSATMLIAWRVLQGIGGAMLAGTVVALLITVFPANERGKVLGIIVAASYIGLSLGPLLGGVLTQHLGWRSIFFLGTVLGSLVIGVVLWKLKGEWTGAKGERFDFAGSVIYVLGLVALVYGFTLLPTMSGVWLIVGGIIGLSVFIWWEMQTRSPVLDMNLFKNSKVFTLSNLAALINYSATYAVTFLISLYLQYLKEFSPGRAGLILVAMPAVQAIFSPLTGRLSDRIEPRLIASAGMVLNTVGIVLFIFVNEETPLKLIIGNLILIGFGYALFVSPNTNAIMSSAPKTAYGVASATLATMRQVGMVLSMGIAMVMFALYVGRVQITPEYYPLFQQSMKTSFIIFAILCFGGIFASLARGKVR
ncbi:MAG: MFS transporter [Chloroflexi bacterium RBG_13_51_36]|nr:MAG: MFS transporter [Chloroflexi bacterium RBG_13_51_36]